MIQILAVFLGGGIGSLMRYGISRSVLSLKGMTVFPVATLLSNVIACILLAFFTLWLSQGKQMSEGWKLFWMVGLCGGFSTFSTFSLENWELYRSGNYTFLVLNILISLGICMAIFLLMARKLP